MANIFIYNTGDTEIPNRIVSYERSVNTPDYNDEPSKLVNPDVSSLSAISEDYWKYSGGSVVEMSQSEKDIVDRVSISGITAWDRDGVLSGKDYKYTRIQIKNAGTTKGWTACTFDEKKILCKWFASGIYAEFNNGEVIWSDAEQRAFLQTFDTEMRNSRVARDEATTYLLQEKVRRGFVLQQHLEVMIGQIKTLRDEYRLDGIEGVGYGDSCVGLYNFLSNDYSYSGLTIISADTTAEQFRVDGDKTSVFTTDKEFQVRSSTDVDGTYTVSASTLDGSETIITVNENITGSTVDGTVYHNGLLGYSWMSISLKTELNNIYIEGIY
jgi:hypothetical protein